MKDLTLLIAHPDDELLFLWPFLDRAARIICVVSDRNNPERQWCSRRAEALRVVGGIIGASVTCLDYSSEFYRMPTRDRSLKVLAESLLLMMDGAKKIATHNPWGEYGHLDHCLCHLLARQTNAPVLTTGIAETVNWLPIKPWSPGKPLGHCELDIGLFESCKAVYDRLGAWTWSRPPVTSCEVYEVC